MFWQCSGVKKCVTQAERPKSPTDQLQQRCAWPVVAETWICNEQVIKWIVSTTKSIWDCRYGRIEAKNNREAAIMSQAGTENLLHSHRGEDSHGRGLRARQVR